MGRGLKYSAEALEIIRRAHKDGVKITTIVGANPDLKLSYSGVKKVVAKIKQGPPIPDVFRDDKEYLKKIHLNWVKRIDKCIEAQGGHFEFSL